MKTVITLLASLFIFSNFASANVIFNFPDGRPAGVINYTFQLAELSIYTGSGDKYALIKISSQEAAQAGLSLMDIKNLVDQYKNSSKCTLYFNASQDSKQAGTFEYHLGALVTDCK